MFIDLPKVQYILIDLDGTLTDPKVGITRSVRYAMQKLEQPLDINASIDWVIGPPLKESLAKLLNVSLHSDLAEQALFAYRERFASIGLFENELYPYVATTLAQLKEQGYQLFLATAKPTIYAEQILQHFEIKQYFDGIYGSELTGERTNKSELISYLLEQEQLDSKHCLMIGDREYDILGARIHGIPSVAVSYGYAQAGEIHQAKPDYFIHHFSEILQLPCIKPESMAE